MAQLRHHEHDIAAAGAGIAAIGTGDVAYARQFKAARHIDFPLLVDDDLVSYRAAEAQSGTLRDLVAPTVLAKGARAVLRGSRQGSSGPAPLLLGATHVIRTDGSVPLAWVNADYADNAPLETVLAALAGSLIE